MGDLPGTCFPGHTATMVHPIIVGHLGELDIFNLGACPWGRLGVGQLVCGHSRCSLLKGGSSLQGSSNSVMSFLEGDFVWLSLSVAVQDVHFGRRQ